jgi:hypothetical protein
MREETYREDPWRDAIFIVSGPLFSKNTVANVEQPAEWKEK